ncbi:pyridoxamine 5'-phosphate oxidase family protein [Nonomuraea sp. KC401]|uniref:pyridoxamine 5'-phosphate oxidase family protein n=1 Tax=unclassified Nonomuraea TaxID=2593643 RepID=UPI0010FD9EF1|nr:MULTISPECIES: pyridoxamine 5'-phosphate oxidase family protein [unclassified Nonomuraea]NBE96749.1 pyridoxamine 5'-phosphate oxidase family protein [Nonomuraea sp. K271]TLF78973.1 pyridoxamine 5'-phosphate oxidase family protein [Nonomuraea sp. KC401]
MVRTPETTIDPRYSSDNAEAIPWQDAVAALGNAELFWVSTIRPDGRPHVTPVVGVWLDDAFYFSTGPEEQKAKNLAAGPHCAVTTGCNRWNEGLDIVLHGDAVPVRDVQVLRRVADAHTAKYGSAWAAEVGDDGVFRMHGHEPLVYEVVPAQALGFGKTEGFSHTRWDFTAEPA